MYTENCWKLPLPLHRWGMELEVWQMLALQGLYISPDYPKFHVPRWRFHQRKRNWCWNLYMVGSLRTKTSPKKRTGPDSFLWLMRTKYKWLSQFFICTEDSVARWESCGVCTSDWWIRCREGYGEGRVWWLGDFFTSCDHRLWRHIRETNGFWWI